MTLGLKLRKRKSCGGGPGGDRKPQEETLGKIKENLCVYEVKWEWTGQVYTLQSGLRIVNDWDDDGLMNVLIVIGLNFD